MGLGTIAQIWSADRAADAQTDAANSANATLAQMYEQQRADNAPWREAGAKAIGQMGDADYMRDFTMGDFQADPGYAFRMAEGAKALERSAAARGGLLSGGAAKAMERYSQGVASDEFNNAYNRFNADRDRRFNRLASIAGMGQTSQAQINAAGQNMANGVAGNQIGIGNANAGRYTAVGNALQQWDNQSKQMAMSAGSMFAMCDIRLKTDIQPIPKEKLAELRKSLRAFSWRYKNAKHGEGIHFGVMAQDLEKSELGRACVFEDASGNKQVDIAKVMMLWLASEAEG